MIMYFTGTGNSEYIAKAMADTLGDETVCANTYIKEGATPAFTSEKPYVFVFPVYLSTSPTILRDFIASCSFSGNKKAYFIPTCASADGSVPNASMDLCKKTGFFEFMGSKKICMPQNYVILFTPFTEEKKQECYKNAEVLVEEICRKIEAGEMLDEKPASGFEYVCTKLIEKWYNSSFTKTKGFHATDACVGCGACAKTCPTNSIEMQNGKPVWVKKVCIHCMGCISLCPKQAIEYGKNSASKPRHVCPKYVPKGTGKGENVNE